MRKMNRLLSLIFISSLAIFFMGNANASFSLSAAIGGETGHVTTIFPEDAGLTQVYGPREKVDERKMQHALGTPPHAVSVISSLESAEVIKVLLGRDGILRNKLLIVDLAHYTFEVIQLS